jgi:hypothetical protein
MSAGLRIQKKDKLHEKVLAGASRGNPSPAPFTKYIWKFKALL